MNKIEIITPKPLERLGLNFDLQVRIPIESLRSSSGNLDQRLFYSLLDSYGRPMMGGSLDVPIDEISLSQGRVDLSVPVQLSSFDSHFLKASQGRITVKLMGWEEESAAHLPVIIEGFESLGGVDPSFDEKHRNVERTILQYREDLKHYAEESAKIRNSRVEDSSILEDVFEIVEHTEEKFEPFKETDEDRELNALEEKYRDALDWRGPFLGASVGRMEGFEFRVYSNDHGQHFHVVHKGRGVDARFSFPEIELINYKGVVGKISSKEKNRIKEYFLKTENFERLRDEFKKRS